MYVEQKLVLVFGIVYNTHFKSMTTSSKTNMNEDLRKEFEKKFGDCIKNISIGQYDDKGVNIGFLKADEVIWQWIETAITKAREETEQRFWDEKNPYDHLYNPNEWHDFEAHRELFIKLLTQNK